MNHVVVHGIQGKRNEYQPVKSILTKGAEPLDIARALKRETRCKAIYLADLDAIQAQGNNRNVVTDLSQALDLEFWVDAGITCTEDIKPLFDAGAAAVILGSETLPDLAQLSEICRTFPPDRLIFSLDLNAGHVISPAAELSGQSPAKALERLSAFHLERFILLTLDGVGTAKGPDIPLLTTAMSSFPGLTFITGGGVKTPAHLSALKSLGLDGVLVATSLHNGWVTQKDLDRLARE